MNADPHAPRAVPDSELPGGILSPSGDPFTSDPVDERDDLPLLEEMRELLLYGR